MSGESALSYQPRVPGGELPQEDTFIAWVRPGQPADRPMGRRIPGCTDPADMPVPAKQPKPARLADVVYCYDGSFAGFLCCVFESFARREIPYAIWTEERIQPTLYEERWIDADETKAKRVYKGYCKLLGGAGRRLLNTTFLSGREDREILLLQFIRLAFCEGPRCLSMLGHEAVAAVYAMDTAIGYETEHLKGFVRFQEVDGILGAVIHPKCRALPLLRGHFCTRYPEEQFLIYDATHSEVLLYQNHRAQILTLEAPLTLPPPSETEQHYQALWKQFYKTLAIDARRNEALRRTHCAKRFWADMTELRDER